MKLFLGAVVLGALVLVWSLYPRKTIVRESAHAAAEVDLAERQAVPDLPQSPMAPSREAKMEGSRRTPLISPTEVRNRTSDALDLARSGDAAAALRLFASVTQQEPTNQKALSEYGHLLAGQGAGSAQIIPPLIAAVRLNPNDGESLALLNDQWTRSGRIDEGIDFLKSLPEDSSARIALGDLLLKAGRPQQAAGYLESFAKTTRTAAVLSMLGTAQLQSGDSQGAEETFKEVKSLRQKELNEVMERGKENPAEIAQKIAWIDLDLANVHWENGQAEQARHLVDAVLQQFPDDPHARELKQRFQIKKENEKG